MKQAQMMVMVDEELQLIYLLEIARRQRAFLEQQQLMYTTLIMPPHLQIEIAYRDEEIARLETRLQALQHKKRRTQWQRGFIAVLAFIVGLFFPHPQPRQRRSPSIMRRVKDVTLLALVLGIIGVIGISMLAQIQLLRNLAGSPLSATMRSIPAGSSTAERVSAAYQTRIIGNTGGIGVRFRNEPYQEALANGALPDGTLVYLREPVTGRDGELWWFVQLEDGSVGYIKDRYLRQP